MSGRHAQACGFDACAQPGFCDGRHCLEAPGTIRLSPKERQRVADTAALAQAFAVLTPPADRGDGDHYTLGVAQARAALAILRERFETLGIAVSPDGEASR